LEILGAHRRHVGDAEHEAYRIEDVGLSRPVESRDRVEGRIPAGDDGADGVRLETLRPDVG
jgi:hypothetical protein